MRVTNRMMTDNAIQHMTDNLDRLNALQEKIASGKNYLNPSDNPVGVSMGLSLRSNLTTLEGYSRAATLAKDWMTASEFSFQQMATVNTRAVNLVTQGLNDALGSSERLHALSTEMDGLLNQALDLANAMHNGQYIFSGYQVNRKPFELTDPNTVAYNGDTGVMQRSLGPDHQVNMNVIAEPAVRPLFQALINARNALQANDTTTLRSALGELQSSLDGLEQTHTSLGARMRQVTLTTDFLDKTQIEMKSLLSQKEDINLAEGISLLSSQENTYQAVLEVGRRAISALNLFDYLR